MPVYTGDEEDKCSGERRPGAAIDAQKNTKIFYKIRCLAECDCLSPVPWLFNFILAYAVLYIQRLLHSHALERSLSWHCLQAF